MINKFMTADEAVAGVKDGMTIMVGGFLGTGSPEVLMDALVRKGVKQKGLSAFSINFPKHISTAIHAFTVASKSPV